MMKWLQTAIGGRVNGAARPHEWHETKGGGTLPGQLGCLAYHGLSAPLWEIDSYGDYCTKAMGQNPICYRSIRMICENAAAVHVKIKVEGEGVTNHPALRLLNAPQMGQCAADFFDQLYGFLLISGNVYIHDPLFGETNDAGQGPKYLNLLRPDRVQIKAGADGWPLGYQYQCGQKKYYFPIEDDSSSVLHIKLFHPGNDHYGLSPLQAARRAIDIHNKAADWNKSLLDNAARPSGALVYKTDHGHLSPEQLARLKQELEISFQGARNAGRPLLLEGGLDWKAMGLSPKDMDFLEAKNSAARDIALAFGVPPMLLGIPGDNTYSNYAEAGRALWRQTILPLVTRVLDHLSNYLSVRYGEQIKLYPDLDKIEALSSERAAYWKRIASADFLTDDEKREALGFACLNEGAER